MPIRVASFGLGAKAYRELMICTEMDTIQIVAGADTAADARERFEDEFDAPSYEEYTELLDRHAAELDAVFVITPHSFHHEHATACFARDLHVFLEKPLATTLSDAVDLVEMAEERDLLLQVGYQRHFHPALQELKRIIASGEIGKLQLISGYLEQEWLDPQRGSWRTDLALSGGGQLYDSGSHLLDSLLWMTGTDPVSVASMIDRRGEEVDVNSALVAKLEREGQPVMASIGITGAGGAYPNTSERLMVWGSEGGIQYVRTLEGEIEAAVIKKPGLREQPDLQPIAVDTTFGELTQYKLENFFDAVRGEADLAVPGEYGLRVLALTEATRLADERGETISVREELKKAYDQHS